MAFNSGNNILGIEITSQNFRRFVIWVQLGFWLIMFLLAYNSRMAQASPIGPFFYVCMRLPLFMGAVYFNYFVLIPYFFERKRYWSYLLSLIFLIIVGQGIRLGLDAIFHDTVEKQAKMFMVPMVMTTILLIGSIMFKFMEEWFRVSQQKAELQNQRLVSELKFLKTQVNPHFLFNTLNNLYSLALLKDDRAPQMIAKLSEIMRYMLTQTRDSHVMLSSEMELFQSYINLHQQQENESQNVDIYTEGIRNRHQIAPLLLINFLENSFNHGAISHKPQG